MVLLLFPSSGRSNYAKKSQKCSVQIKDKKLLPDVITCNNSYIIISAICFSYHKNAKDVSQRREARERIRAEYRSLKSVRRGKDGSRYGS